MTRLRLCDVAGCVCVCMSVRVCMSVCVGTSVELQDVVLPDRLVVEMFVPYGMLNDWQIGTYVRVRLRHLLVDWFC